VKETEKEYRDTEAQAMRALELYGIYDQWKGKIDLETSAKPRITLRYLNQLKLQRKRRAAEFAKKQPLIAAMYGEMEQHEAEGAASRSRRQGIAIGDRNAYAGTGAAEGPDPGQTDASGIDVE
jgi:hypothetical protein